MPLGVDVPGSGCGSIMPPPMDGAVAKGEAFMGGAPGAGAIPPPPCVAAISRGSFEAGRGIIRGSCGEIGV